MPHASIWDDWRQRFPKNCPWGSGSRPGLPCPCFELTQPFLDGTLLERLTSPCQFALSYSCFTWSDLQRPLRTAGDEYTTWLGTWNIPLGATGWLLEPTMAEGEPNWPTPALNAPYGLAAVLRQWVEGPDPKLARQLVTHPSWNAALRSLDHYLPDLLDEWCITPQLPHYDLPATPATARFLRFCWEHPDRDPADAPPPSRGGQLVTFCLVEKAAGSKPPGKIIHNPATDSRWMNDSLQRAMATAERQHAEWWGRFVTLPSYSAQGRPPGASSDDELGTLIELLRRGELSGEGFKRECLARLRAELNNPGLHTASPEWRRKAQAIRKRVERRQLTHLLPKPF